MDGPKTSGMDLSHDHYVVSGDYTSYDWKLRFKNAMPSPGLVLRVVRNDAPKNAKAKRGYTGETILVEKHTKFAPVPACICFRGIDKEKGSPPAHRLYDGAVLIVVGSSRKEAFRTNRGGTAQRSAPPSGS